MDRNLWGQNSTEATQENQEGKTSWLRAEDKKIMSDCLSNCFNLEEDGDQDIPED